MDSLRSKGVSVNFDPANMVMITGDDPAAGVEELPLGEGKVDFETCFSALQEIGYKGYLTIEREVGGNPESDIRKAVEFIRRYQ